MTSPFLFVHILIKNDVKAIDAPFRFNRPYPFICMCTLWIIPNRILPSKFSSDIAQPTIIHPLDYHNKKLFHMECSGCCKNSASFPVMCYLVDFIDIAHTVHNFIRRTKLISSFFKEEIELIISKITKFHNKITKFQNFISNLSWYLLKW